MPQGFHKEQKKEEKIEIFFPLHILLESKVLSCM